MKSENMLMELLSKLFSIFSANPLFNIFYRWLFISGIPAVSGYYFCSSILNQENLAKHVFFFVFIIPSILFVYSVLHLPQKKNTRYIYIMLYSNNNDPMLIANGIAPKCQNLSKNKSYRVSCPSKSCRYFYNWIKSKQETSNSKIIEFFNAYIEKSDSIFLFGVINDQKSHNSKVSKIIPNIYTSIDSNSATNVTSLIECASFVIKSNDSCNEIDSFSQMIISYADYIFSTIDDGPQLKKLCYMLDIYENAQCVSTDFSQNNFRIILENMAEEITHRPIEETEFNEYILFCERFLKSFPNNIKILLDWQYFSIIRIKDNKSMLPLDIKQTAEKLLEAINITSPATPDGTILELNRAYLSLLAGNYDCAIRIYHSIPILPPEIFRFFKETLESPTLGIYSKFAFVINYAHDSSSENRQKALMIAQSLNQQTECELYSELQKRCRAFVKNPKNRKKKQAP